MKTTLGPHDDPPVDFSQQKLPIWLFRCTWFRIYRLLYDPIFFGCSGDNRFDAPAGEFRVMYAGRDVHCAFVETFGHATGVRVVEQKELADRGLAIVKPTRPLRLVNLAGEGLARLGVDARLTSGESYDVAHRWALAIHEHPKKPDGIIYTARHDSNRICVALFERTRPHLEVTRLGSLADSTHASLVASLLNTYGFGLI